MSSRLLGPLAVVLLALILVSRSGQERPVATAPTAPAVPEPVPSATRSASRAPRVAPLPNALDRSPSATREIDLLAILAIRRRIQREGTQVYLDSLLAQTDSTLVRWADRGGRPITVAVQPDSTLEDWDPAFLAAARQGLIIWRNNAAGLAFEEVADTASAEILVQFVTSVSDSNEFGVTRLDWQPDGTATRATIRLALHPVADGPVVTVPALQRVAVHEFGHALGLPHSGSRNDIMHPSSPVAQPSRRDQATLQLLYAIPPGSIKTP